MEHCPSSECWLASQELKEMKTVEMLWEPKLARRKANRARVFLVAFRPGRAPIFEVQVSIKFGWCVSIFFAGPACFELMVTEALERWQGPPF